MANANKEEEAKEYLKTHRIMELFENLTAHLAYERPGKGSSKFYFASNRICFIIYAIFDIVKYFRFLCFYLIMQGLDCSWFGKFAVQTRDSKLLQSRSTVNAKPRMSRLFLRSAERSEFLRSFLFSSADGMPKDGAPLKGSILSSLHTPLRFQTHHFCWPLQRKENGVVKVTYSKILFLSFRWSQSVHAPVYRKDARCKNSPDELSLYFRW